MFVELNELTMDKNQEMQWKETARWIKFEEDVEEETDRWGKPHVASLSFRSLLELRRTISHGKVFFCQFFVPKVNAAPNCLRVSRSGAAGLGPEDPAWHRPPGRGTNDYF